MLCPLSAQRLRSTDFILFGNPQDPTKLNKKWERKGMGSKNSQTHSKLCVHATLNGKKHKPRWACTQIFHLKGRRHPWSWTAGHQQRTEAVVKVDSASQRRRRRIKLWKPLTLLSRHPKVLWGHALLDLDAGALHSIVSSGVTRFWMRIRHGRSSRPWESVVPQQQLFWFQTSGPEYSYMCWVEYVSLNWLCGTDSYALSSSSPLNRLILFYSMHHSFFISPISRSCSSMARIECATTLQSIEFSFTDKNVSLNEL